MLELAKLRSNEAEVSSVTSRSLKLLGVKGLLIFDVSCKRKTADET